MKRKALILLVWLLPFTASAQLLFCDAGKDTTICVGDSVVLGGPVLVAGGMAPYNPVWSPNFNISSVTDSHPTVWPFSSTIYHLDITDANGRSAHDSVIITVHSPPFIAFLPVPELCWKDQPYHFSQGVPPGGYYSGAGVEDSASLDPAISGIGNHLIYYVYTDQTCQFSDSESQIVTVNLNPNVLPNPYSDTICKGDTVTLTASGALLVKWFPFNKLSSDTGHSVHCWVDTSTAIKVTGISAEGCKDSIYVSIKVVDCGNSIDEHSGIHTVQAYPNPVSAYLYLSADPKYQPERYGIYALDGRLRKSGKIEWNNGRATIEIRQLPKGTYILRFSEHNPAIVFIKN